MVRKYFNRYEIKYQLDLSERDRLIRYLNGFMNLDKHTLNGQDYEVRSVYYDSIHRNSYYEKDDGIKIRRKLRIRYYPDSPEVAFVEIKRKMNENVSKARIVVPIDRSTDILESSNEYSQQYYTNATLSDKKTLDEIWYLYKVFNLKPVCMVNYHRQAYAGNVENRFRITFDTNLTVRNRDFNLLVGGGSKKIIPSHRTVMEVKFNGFIPQWALNIIQLNDCTQEKISKFATGLKKSRSYSLI